ncbi:hypothetical protein [Sphingomonas jeddahensis]|uniref:Uncharacterized protein n=1 Tax=Sphingomonas jeddahensis TaxID=1915074 RepID=A0A1V2EQW2_9SPHN|nr:hypothetical protein [Sphingomonas jeddahensis]ONF95071.1 hypothetical protein SPHI_27740 [Sphingomonas jeddahensis]
MSDTAEPVPKQRTDVYHRERAIMERRAATKAHDVRARAAHLELAYQHDLAQAIAWHRADLTFDPAATLRVGTGADQTPSQASGGGRSTDAKST